MGITHSAVHVHSSGPSMGIACPLAYRSRSLMPYICWSQAAAIKPKGGWLSSARFWIYIHYFKSCPPVLIVIHFFKIMSICVPPILIYKQLFVQIMFFVVHRLFYHHLNKYVLVHQKSFQLKTCLGIRVRVRNLDTFIPQLTDKRGGQTITHGFTRTTYWNFWSLPCTFCS